MTDAAAPPHTHWFIVPVGTSDPTPSEMEHNHHGRS